MLVFVVLACGIVLASCNDDTNVQSTTTTTTTPIIEYCKHDDPEKIVVVEEKTPTCQETGLTEGMKCLNCETMVVPQRIIETIDCVDGEWIVDLEPTKTEDGKRHTECTMCGKIVTEQIIGAGSQGLTFYTNGENSYALGKIGTCTDTDIVIPRTYNGVPVTFIASNAFLNCTSLISITIPDSVIGIGSQAFHYCTLLTSVTIPDSVANIETNAFRGCASLENIILPNSIMRIGWGVFQGCTSLKKISFEGTIEQWNAIDKDVSWYWDSAIVEIICTDGTITLE